MQTIDYIIACTYFFWYNLICGSFVFARKYAIKDRKPWQGKPMHDIVNSILNGNYIQSVGAISPSVTKLEIEVANDCDYEGSFIVSTDGGEAMEGYVLSSDTRLEILGPNIAGPRAEVSYYFHGNLCRAGDEVNGNITIVSDHGEIIIPFFIKIGPGELSSSMGPVKNLFNFVNLAKTNWKEALDLFYDPEFRRIFCGVDEYFNGLYSVLSANKGNEQNLEEFLLCTGKKSRVQYFYDKKVFETTLIGVEYSEKLVEREIEILRNGWGYTDIRIDIDGDFLLTRRDVLTEKDFVGNLCTLKIFIDTEKCTRGRREGKIVIHNNFSKLEIPVVVKGRFDLYGKNKVRTRTRLLAKMTADYIDSGLGLLNEKEWFERTGACVEQMGMLSSDDPYVKLFKARLLCIEGRQNEASWLVDQAGEMIEQQKGDGKLVGEDLLVLYSYHWLIASMVKQDHDFTRLAAGKIDFLSRKYPGNWQIAVISLLLPTSNNRNADSRYRMLEGLFENGCRSAVIYYEALKALNENPPCARKVDDFLIQTLYFGAKKEVLSERLMEHFLSMTHRARRYTYVHIHLLKLLFKKYGDSRILQDICSGLITENRLDASAHTYYRLAIENEIKLTNLYEYYIRSIDLYSDEEIPLVVLMYFGYSNTLAEEHLAFFYHYLIRHKDRFEDLYTRNLENMARFTDAQIIRGNIDRNLALIYSDILDPASLTRQQAIGIADMIFSKWIICEKKECETAYVYQKGCINPFRYEMKDGKGAVSIYGTGNILVFEDSDGNRYVESAQYTSEDLMSVGRYQGAVKELVWDNERLNLYILGTGNSSVTVTDNNISRFMQLAESRLVRKAVRMRMLVSAMDYYSIHDDEQNFERGLGLLDMTEITGQQMGVLFPILNKYGHYDITEDWLCKYGPYFVSKGNLRRYVERKIMKMQGNADAGMDKRLHRALVAAAIHVFREGDAGSVITEFVAKNFEGSSRELVSIWRTLKKYELKCNDLCGRIMLRHLYTDTFIPDVNEIAIEFISEDTSSPLAQAVVAQGAYRYFLGKEGIDGQIILDIKRMYEMGINIPASSKLAFLKYYSEHPEETKEEVGEIVLLFLKEEIDNRVYLGFFKKFLSFSAFVSGKQAKRCAHILDEIADRTIVDYRVSKGKVAKIHYLIVSDGTESYDYSAENMREACSGVCFKDFILFFGETLQYYITEENEDESTLQGNGQISINYTGEECTRSKYALINDMIVSNTTKNYNRFDNLLEEYEKREYLDGQLFRLV